MAVLTCTGEVVSRSCVYTTPVKQRKQKRHKLPKRNRSVISEKQAQTIIDMQIARRLKRMF